MRIMHQNKCLPLWLPSEATIASIHGETARTSGEKHEEQRVAKDYWCKSLVHVHSESSSHASHPPLDKYIGARKVPLAHFVVWGFWVLRHSSFKISSSNSFWSVNVDSCVIICLVNVLVPTVLYWAHRLQMLLLMAKCNRRCDTT